MKSKALGRTWNSRPLSVTRATVLATLHSGETVIVRTKTYRRSPVDRAQELIRKAGFILGEVQAVLAGWHELYHLTHEQAADYSWAPSVYIPDDDQRRRKE